MTPRHSPGGRSLGERPSPPSERRKTEAPAGTATVLRAVMVAALDLELEACRPRGRDWRRIEAGRAVRGKMGVLHEFPWADDDGADVQVGHDVLVELDGWSRMIARVADSTPGTLVLAVRGDLPQVTPAGRVTPDARWILRRLREHLLGDLAGRGDALPLELIGASASSTGRHPPEIPALPRELNSEQREAAVSGMSEGVTHISAGPGTGKTTTIGALVAMLEEQGRRVLIVAPSNRAADQCALSICERLETRPEFGDGLVVREGHPALCEFRRRFGEATDRARIAWRRIASSTSADPDPHWLAEEERRVLDDAAVVITATARTWVSPLLAQQRFDVAILDEGSMTLLPAAYHVASLARRAVVLVGDRHQLPPVVRSRDPVVEAFLRSSPLDPSTTGPRPARGPRRVALRLQHRMDPSINALANELMYEGTLEPADSVLSRSPLPGPALLLLDSSSRSPRPSGRRGHANPVHAVLTREVIAWLRRSFACHEDDIAVLSRYRAQAALLHQQTRRTGRVVASTVHRAQGGEFHTVIVDLSAAPGGALGDYVTDVRPESLGARLLSHQRFDLGQKQRLGS